MSRHPRARRTPKGPLFAALALLLVSGLLSASPLAAHTFTKKDGDDSPSRLDIRSSSVEHSGRTIVHTIRTHEGWTPKSLGKDSFFVVEIDKDFDNDFEQCAFIFFAGGKLRGSLTNCRQTFIRSLNVAKATKAVASIKIPTENTGHVYRWVVFSFWTGLPARCSDLCFDAAPNSPPPILHDLKPPVVTMPEPLFVRVSDIGTTTDFPFPFGVTDAHSSISSWTIQRSPAFGLPVWTAALSGSGAGSKSPTIEGTPPGRFKFRVLAVDKQGNEAIGDPRFVHVPTDISPSGPGVFSDATAAETPLADAWAGGFVPMDAGESYTLELTTPDDGCLVELVGPGSGDWVVDVNISGSVETINADQFANAPRQMLFDWRVSSPFPTTFTITVTSGTGFGIDAIVI